MQTVLIIDDDSSLRSLMSMALRGNGFGVIEAQNGSEGFTLARERLPDLVISDVNMEGLDGYGFLKNLRSLGETAAIPVILMTGDSSNDMRQSMEKGADDYLSKPFKPATLISAVKTRLNRKEAIDHRIHDVQERLLSIVSSTSDLVAILDRDAECTVYLNPAGRALLGIGAGEDVAQFNLKQCFTSEEARDEFERRIKQAEADGRWTGECHLTGRNNQSVPVELQLLAHRAENGHVTWLSVIASDATATMQLRQAQKMEAIGRLAAGIAHEINTPAQYVGDNTQFLKDSFQGIGNVMEAYRAVFNAAKSGSVSKELLQRVEQAEAEGDLAYLMEQIPSALNETIEGINRITKIVRAMKEFSHPGKNEKSPTDLNKAIETTATVARNEWRYVAELTLNLDPQLPLVPCLGSEFNQAMLNLIVNAAHAIGDVVKKQSGTKGNICITTRRVGNDVEVRVADTGSGIPVEVRPRIFEPFFTTKRVGEGTGQGLAFVYNSVVKKHGGKISFETEPGKGTTFVLILPLNAQSAEKR